MPEGFFHDATDVYCRSNDTTDWMWVATFMSRKLAEHYAKSSAFPAGVQIELRNP